MCDVLVIKNIKNIKSRIFLFYILSVVNLFIYADENTFNCCNLSFINTKNSEEVNTNKNISDDYDGEIYEGKDIEQDSIYNMPNINNILDKIYTLKEVNYKYGINTQYNFLKFGNSIEIISKENKDININQNSTNNIEEGNDENVFNSDFFEFSKDLNEAQKEAVLSCGQPQLVLSGAGSGKTRVLTYKIIFLLKTQNINPENILALTFTNR